MGHVHGVARPSRAVTAATTLTLSILFVAVYGLTDWLASLRADVGIWSFAWERNVPFVSWLVVPYVSLDLFFVAAPFLCADREELRILARRVTAAILIAGVMFLMMPLQFAYPRPGVSDWTAPIFHALHAFDRPYNLFPSLHIAILTLLAAVYDRHSDGLVRWGLRIWFGLIAVSTVLTWQHHIIDVAGGFALALCCRSLITEHGAPQPIIRSSRVGTYYAGAALVFVGLVWWLGRSALVLVWPVLSMTLVSGAYFGFYGDVTRKRAGRLPLVARVMLAPWVGGEQLSLIYYRRYADPWNEVAPGVWMGRHLRTGEAAHAVKSGVTAVLDLTCEFPEVRPFLSVPYLNLPVLDLTAPTQAQIRTAIAFINAYVRDDIVYVHCKIGYSRTAAVVGCWLLDAGYAANAEAAVALMARARPSLVVRPEAWAALRQFQAEIGLPPSSARVA